MIFLFLLLDLNHDLNHRFKSKKWLRNCPWIFLFQNLFDHTASPDVVRIKWWLCHSSDINLIA